MSGEPSGVTRSAIPTATYRLQLHKGFTLDDAASVVTYLRDLGISHLYLSPILKARAGSMHGYDVVDHREINPELGGEAALRRLSAVCTAAGLGIILDIVPNHMAVGEADNEMWLDVLEHGRASNYAYLFDIDFTTDMAQPFRIIVPFLGRPYTEALRTGKISLVWDGALGKLVAAYGPHRFPIRPQDCAEILGEGTPQFADLSPWQAPDRLHDLLERQNFRLVWYRAAGDSLNWRRFFDVNSLAALRADDPRVFDLTHAITLRLYGEGVIDGVRVDHVDGLADPAAYVHQLRAALDDRTAERPPGAPPDGPYIVLEKILGHDEPFASAWGADGTTGYDFMDQVSALQHAASGEAPLTALWHEIAGTDACFDKMETAARGEILRTAFAGQLAACAAAFAHLAGVSIDTRDLTAEGFRRVLETLVGRLRVYRGYATGAADAPALPSTIAAALDSVSVLLPGDFASVDFLRSCTEGCGPGTAEDRAVPLRRLHQLTAPIAAKAVEDTAFYRFGRLLSRNDVGFDASRFAMAPGDFLATGAARATSWPYAMLTTATHDHKRGEDVRARLAVLSEIPDLWADTVRQWFAMTEPTRPAVIASADAYMLWQTLVGAWPFDLRADHHAGVQALRDRVAGWQEKSLREAKLHTSWTAQNHGYESACAAWLSDLLSPGASPAFLANLNDFVDRIAPAAAVNGMVQAALRCTWPGVPDLYQGCELWDLSLVDPDNRRPVDFALRRELLGCDAKDWVSGAAKQALIADLLRWRRADSALFQHGAVEALPVRGSRAAHIFAFRRADGARQAIVAVLRDAAHIPIRWGAMPPATWWQDTAIQCGANLFGAASLFHSGPVFAAPDMGQHVVVTDSA